MLENIISSVTSCVMNVDAIELVVMVLVLICLIASIMQLFRLVNVKDKKVQIELSHEMFDKWLESLKDNEDNRYEEIAELMEKDGYQAELPKLYMLDELLVRGGLKNNDSGMPTEFILAMFFSADLVISIIVMLFTGSLLYGVWSFVGFTFLGFGYVRYRADLNYTRVEKQTIRFISCAARFEATSDDIVTIFANVSKYVDEPLKGYLEDFFYESMYLGKSEAFDDLESSIENAHMRGLIHDIRVCSETNSSYSDILNAALAEAEEYDKGRIERLNIVKNFRIQTILIVAGCLASMKIFGGIIEGGSIFNLMRQTFTGNLLLTGLAASILFSLYSLVKTDRR